MSSEENKPKIGEGHAAAMARLGLRELRGSLYPESNVAQQTEYGLYGTRTPGEVAEARRSGENKGLEEVVPDQTERSVLADRMQQADGRDDRGRDSKSLEKE